MRVPSPAASTTARQVREEDALQPAWFSIGFPSGNFPATYQEFAAIRNASWRKGRTCRGAIVNLIRYPRSPIVAWPRKGRLGRRTSQSASFHE
jgi:hypothetical protein